MLFVNDSRECQLKINGHHVHRVTTTEAVVTSHSRPLHTFNNLLYVNSVEYKSSAGSSLKSPVETVNTFRPINTQHCRPISIEHTSLVTDKHTALSTNQHRARKSRHQSARSVVDQSAQSRQVSRPISGSGVTDSNWTWTHQRHGGHPLPTYRDRRPPSPCQASC